MDDYQQEQPWKLPKATESYRVEKQTDLWPAAEPRVDKRTDYQIRRDLEAESECKKAAEKMEFSEKLHRNNFKNKRMRGSLSCLMGEMKKDEKKMRPIAVRRSRKHAKETPKPDAKKKIRSAKDLKNQQHEFKNKKSRGVEKQKGKECHRRRVDYCPQEDSLSAKAVECGMYLIRQMWWVIHLGSKYATWPGCSFAVTSQPEEPNMSLTMTGRSISKCCGGGWETMPPACKTFQLKDLPRYWRRRRMNRVDQFMQSFITLATHGCRPRLSCWRVEEQRLYHPRCTGLSSDSTTNWQETVQGWIQRNSDDFEV